MRTKGKDGRLHLPYVPFVQSGIENEDWGMVIAVGMISLQKIPPGSVNFWIISGSLYIICIFSCKKITNLLALKMVIFADQVLGATHWHITYTREYL